MTQQSTPDAEPVTALAAEDVTREISEALRENNHLRHRLGIESGPEPVEGESNVIAYTDKYGSDWFIQVQGS
jgi:hypothetical protein